MKREDAKEFTQSLEKVGDGWWRLVALGIRQGVPKALGYTGPDGPKNWVRECVSPNLRISDDAKPRAIAELKDEGMSHRQIGAALGIGPANVSRTLNGGDPNGSPGSEKAAENSHLDSGGDPNGSPQETPNPKGHHLARTTGNNEWYTPAEDIERARKVLGALDLDPASSVIAQETVKAERYFTKEQDGLQQEWSGRVWMNPPYAKGDIEPFVTKLVAEYRAGTIKSAIMLTNNSADTEWFHKAAAHAGAICLTRGRLKFGDPEKEKTNSPMQGQAFFYFGPNVKKFVSLYAPTGVVLLPYRG